MEETLGPDGTLGRETKGEVVLASRLRAALVKLNPSLPSEAISSAMDELTRDRSAMSLEAANREVYQLLKEGIKVSIPDTVRGGQKTERLRVMDWEHPKENDFLLVSQFSVTGALYTCRPDLIGFVNGLPLVVIELKKPGVPVRQAFDENLTHYKQQVPSLFWYNALLIASNGTDSRVGSLTADWDRFFEWKRIESENEPRRVSLETMLRGTCDKTRLLDLTENFTLFSEHKAGLTKIIGQNHQVLGVNNAITSLLEARKEGHGRGGVFWQTQGSGKSFSMVFFAQKILRKSAGNWTFVVVTDRVELDEQIAKTFKTVGAVSEAEGDQCHASSGAHLRELLRGNHRYIFSLIQKFQPEHLSSEKPSSPALLPEGEGSPHYWAGYRVAGLTKRVRELRKEGTKAEDILWEFLRNRKLGGMKFRRQHQIGDYIVDFYCAEARLVVDLDGEVHDCPEVAAKDRIREKWLLAQGLSILRFRNEDLLTNPMDVLVSIKAFLPPSTSGRGAGGESQQSRMPVLSDNEDLIVIVDEAHRSQYDTLAMNMRAALPKAMFVAFTGTPLIAGEERTKEIFGDYVSIYDFQQSVEDGATVPLYYENRTPELQIINPDLNEDIYDVIEAAGLDADQEEKLEKQLGRQYHILTRDDRLDTIARDIVNHFLGRGFVGKAMVVSIDKATALRMHDKVCAAWNEELARVKKELLGHYALSADRKDELLDRLQVLQTTDMALIVSPGQNEIEQMQKLGLDIEPHRKRMHDEDLGEKFKDPDDPLRIVFLCAMWLTGFDAPSCSTVYLDKPMRNHTLMQTIARANRVFPGKHSGMIVDYANVFASLEKALAIYGQGGGGETPVRDKQQLVENLRKAISDATTYCTGKGVNLAAIEGLPVGDLYRLQYIDDARNALIAPDYARKEFLANERLVSMLYKAVKPDPAALEFFGRTTCLTAIADAIRATLNPDPVDISEVMGRVNEVLDNSITGVELPTTPTPLIDLSKVDFETLRDRLKKSKHRNTDLEMLKAAIRSQLEKLIRLNKTRTDYLEKFEELIESYNNGSRNIEQILEDLLNFTETLSEEQQRHLREHLTEEELTVFDILTRPGPELSQEEREEVKKVAHKVLSRLKALLGVDWRCQTQARAKVRLAIEDELDSGLPETYTRELFSSKCSALFEHVYESYYGEDISIYSNTGGFL